MRNFAAHPVSSFVSSSVRGFVENQVTNLLPLLSMVLLPFLVTITAHADNLPDRFFWVTPAIARGARPTFAHLSALQKLGVRRIVNLDNDITEGQKEQVWSAQLGLEYVAYPMSVFTTPDANEVNQILGELHAAPEKTGSIYLHCQAGRDRTGLLIALYRVLEQKWTRQAADDEMLQVGFHRILFQLENFFWSRTDGLPFEFIGK